MLLEVIYNIFIYPIEFILEIIFYLFYNKFQSSFGLSLIFLSIFVNLLSLPLYNIAEKWQKAEREIQNKMKPMIDNIKAVYKGDQRYLLIRACHRINGYKTIYAFRGTFGLLIQIPFFIAAYNFIYSISYLGVNQKFLFINDLSKVDALLTIGSININILPFLMTIFSLLSGFVYSNKLKFKDSIPLYIISLIFLVLLYNSPSGLLLYWCYNCLFSLIKNIAIEYEIFKFNITDKFIKAYNILFIIFTILFILVLSLSSIERKAYLTDLKYIGYENSSYKYTFKISYYSLIFKSSDIFKFEYLKEDSTEFIENIFIDNSLNTVIGSVYLSEEIENISQNIDIFYKLSVRNYIFNIFYLLFIILFLVNINTIYNFIFNKNDSKILFEKNNNKLFILSSLIISILLGLFIPSSLIKNSPLEFTKPISLIMNNLFISIGIFLFYPFLFYFLSYKKIRSYLSLVFIIFLPIILINIFLFSGNYININGDFIFDDSKLLISSLKENIYNIICIFLVSLIFILLFKYKKIKIVLNFYYILLISLVLISTTNIVSIFHTITKNNINSYVYKDNSKIFNLSKSGTNVFVIVLDRAINSYWIDSIKYFPEFKTNFDGFTIFPNTVSFSGSTITVASLYGGYEYLPYDISTNGSYNLIEKHNEALKVIPLALDKYNYKSALINPAYANFSWIPDLSVFSNEINNNNLEVYNNNSLINIDKKDSVFNKILIRFSIFKTLPINFRYDFYSDKNWFINIKNMYYNSSIYDYNILKSIQEHINITNNGNYFNLIHNDITHQPQYFNSNFLPSVTTLPLDDKFMSIYKDENSVRHFYVNVAAMNLIVEFINYLKNNKVYDNTKIIIVSDHGFNLNTTITTDKDINYVIARFNALLLYKDFNSRGEFNINTNFMTIADTPYLATKHISNVKNIFTDKVIVDYYKTNKLRIVDVNSWKASEQLRNRYAFDFYYIIENNIFDTNNWKKFKIDWKTKTEVEVPIK